MGSSGSVVYCTSGVVVVVVARALAWELQSAALIVHFATVTVSPALDCAGLNWTWEERRGEERRPGDGREGKGRRQEKRKGKRGKSWGEAGVRIDDEEKE